MNLSPIQLLREAIKAVPSLKYALGVAGLIAVVAIVGAFRIRPEIAVFGAIATLVLMVALLIFAKLTKTAQKHFLVPALVLMWSFLVLVIAAASLLFSSTFFNWPMNFRATPLRPEKGVSSPDGAEAEAVVREARQRLGTGDFQGAWKTLQGIASGPSRSDAVLNTQVDVAMVWLGMLVSMGPHTKEVYDDLTAVFFAALPKAKGNRAADIQAHIGWAYHLMSKEYPHAGVNIDAELRKALDFEPQNPYANAMLGYRLLFPTEKVEEARKHFETALASKREVPWVRSMQLEAFELLDRDAYKLELARIANEMRKNGEPMSDERKRKLFYGVYWSGANYSFLTNLIHSLPSSEHLSTLDWLAGEELWAKSWPEQRFVLAALRERTGDWSGALQFYTNLARLGDPYQEEIKSAIARCKARARAM